LEVEVNGGLILVAMTLLALAWAVSWHPPSARHQAKRTAARQQIKSFHQALAAYLADTKTYPPTLQGLRVAPERVKGWRGPYLPQDIPTDPWGTPYVYSFEGQVRIVSLGADRKPGGEGNAEDVK